MYKNMTRKGLALGAGLALVGSTFAALPAQAAGTITLSPSAGTSYNTLSNSTFTLMPVITGVQDTEYKYLRYKVSNADESTFRVDVRQATANAQELVYQYGTASTLAVESPLVPSLLTLTASAAGADSFAFTVPHNHLLVDTDIVFASQDFAVTGANAAVITAIQASGATTGISEETLGAGDSSITATVVTLGEAVAAVTATGTDMSLTAAPVTAGSFEVNNIVKDDSFVVRPSSLSGNNAAAIGAQNYLEITPRSQSTTSVAIVQAWIDANQNNTIDAGEIASAAETVTFKPVGTLSASVSSDAIYDDSRTITTALTFTGDINYQQITAGQVTSTTSATTGAITGAGTQNYAWNAVTGRYEAGDAVTGVDDGEVILTTVKVDNDYDDAVDDSKATVSVTITATIATPSFEAMVVDSATAVNTLSQRVDSGTGITDFTTRAGTGAALEGSTGFSVKLFVGTNAATLIGSPSAPVSVAVTSTNVTATDAVTVGGKALVTGTTTTLNVVTDANGFATIPVSLGAADDADTIVFTSSPFGAAVANALTVTVTDNSADYTVTQVTPGSPSIEVGDSLSIEYKVVDFFGVAPKNNTHSVLVAPTANERTKAAVWSYSIPVVDGKAVLTVTDNGTGVGKFTANAKLVVNGTTSALNAEINTVVNVVADKDAAKIVAETLTYGALQAKDLNNDGDYSDTNEVDNRSALLLETKAFADYDSRYNVPTVSAPEVRDTYKVVVGGKVTNAAGTAIVGAPVTFAAAGFLFSDGTTFAKDSITVHAGSTGIASVSAWSSVGGAQTITMTSGTATASQKLVFAAGTGSVASFTVTAPAFADAGTTADVTITAKDKYGNPAKGATVTLFSKGSGYLINTTGTTLSNGTFSTKLLLGSNDKGSAVISAVVTIDGVETTQTATITVGSEQKVNAGSFKGYVALYAKGYAGQRMSAKVGKDWVIVPALASDFERVVEFTGAGVDVAVRIYIDRVLMDTINLTTK